MTKDPLGKRALFSPSQKGGFAVTVECTSCGAHTNLSLPALVVRHVPVGAWLPWRRDSNLMRCPACGRLAWHAVSRAT